MNKLQLIEFSYKVFSSFNRPEYFTDISHCPECADHNNTMKKYNLDELGVNEIGNLCLSPLSFLTEEAFGYVMPRLIELATKESVNKEDSFLFNYLVTLTPSEPDSRFEKFNEDQNLAIKYSLQFIKKELYSVAVRECFEEDLKAAIRAWGV